MLKNISNLGKKLNKKEQTTITGGEFCMIHCLDECISGLDNYTSEGGQYCSQLCIRLSGGNGGF
ncbi:hypothetical protein [Tenacibaculum jejuense]|uniref:Uncharacterized protein n=1 Tax=Tenacibaculum jejuense TaxID=584609 RepID=A0A238U7U1_9FLAO|nr:hypothetical protein [Tenacibaculum jejuense]SNR15115.1 protein of unknown function [Tenacibaculum jejuense]